MKIETSSIHDWDLHQSINAGKTERNNEIRILISEYFKIPLDFITPNSKIFILAIMASIVDEAGVFGENTKVDTKDNFIIPDGLFIKYNLKDEVKEKITTLLKLEELYQKNKTRAGYEALFLNYNINVKEIQIIGLIQKIMEILSELSLFDLEKIIDIRVEDFLEQ